MAYPVKDLRYKTKQVLSGLKRGERPIISYRGRPIAQIIPFPPTHNREFTDVGFGMWKQHLTLKDPSQWVNKQRKPRYKM